MSKIAVVGGYGKVSRHLHPLLVSAGYTPVALVRNDTHLDELVAMGAEVRRLDIEKSTAADFSTAFSGCQAVVFAAGAGSDGDVDRKRTVDLGGSLKSIEGAEAAGISRFVQISAISVDDPTPADASPVWAAYVDAKRRADEALRASRLQWTILRPGTLTDEPSARQVILGRDVPKGAIPRADVAAVIVAVLANDATVGRQWELTQGDLEVDEAIAKALLAD